MSVPSCLDPEVDLTAALTGDPQAARRLEQHFSRYLLASARRRAPDLPHDLAEEIVQEVWLELYQGPLTISPSPSQSAKKILRSLLSHAADRVRAAYRDPGGTSRARDARRRQRPAAAPIVALEHAQEMALIDVSAERAQVALEAAIDLRLIRRKLSSELADVLDTMLRGQLSLSEAATLLGLNRLRVQRALLQVRERLAA